MSGNNDRYALEVFLLLSTILLPEQEHVIRDQHREKDDGYSSSDQFNYVIHTILNAAVFAAGQRFTGGNGGLSDRLLIKTSICMRLRGENPVAVIFVPDVVFAPGCENE